MRCQASANNWIANSCWEAWYNAGDNKTTYTESNCPVGAAVYLFLNFDECGWFFVCGKGKLINVHVDYRGRGKLLRFFDGRRVDGAVWSYGWVVHGWRVDGHFEGEGGENLTKENLRSVVEWIFLIVQVVAGVRGRRPRFRTDVKSSIGTRGGVLQVCMRDKRLITTS